MRRITAALAALFLCCLVADATAGSAPPGATAVCRDGTYSFSQHHSGTCSYHGGVARWLDGSTGSSSASVPLGASLSLARRTATSGCRRGALPDRRCSPGAYYSGLTRAIICSPTFRTSTIRNVPTSEKYAVEREYGMAARPYGRTIEIDHIVSLELGGSNDVANLFPEPGGGVAGYRVKDKLENRLHALVCAGQMTLASARNAIAGNWEQLYVKVFRVEP